jgi:hypothetical protein
MCRNLLRRFPDEHQKILYTGTGTHYTVETKNKNGLTLRVPKNHDYGWVRALSTPWGTEWDEEEQVAKANGYYPMDDREVEVMANGRPWFKAAFGAYTIPRHKNEWNIRTYLYKGPKLLLPATSYESDSFSTCIRFTNSGFFNGTRST